MKARYLALAMAIVAASCAANEDSKAELPAPAPQQPLVTPTSSDAAPTQAQATLVIPSIASAYLSEDCPDPKTELAAASTAPDSKKAKRKSDSAGPLVQPCSQSYVQLAFSGQASGGERVELKAVRLLSLEGKQLATLRPRMPTIWKEGVFVPWDGLLSAEQDQKSSYKLSIPDWAALEKDSGSSSFGQVFVLEVDVAIDAATTTLRSPQFERARPELIKT